MAAPKKRRLLGEINVVPYIDVMLVLLIIFMVTAPLLTQGIEVELPKASAKPLDRSLTEDDLPLVLSIDADGNLYLNVGADDNSPIVPAEVVRQTTIVLRTRPETPVLVKADHAVDYGRVVTGMVLLQRGGAERVGFITDPLDELPES
ncbi:MAG: protein TolR [Pseudomonadota bacterium]